MRSLTELNRGVSFHRNVTVNLFHDPVLLWQRLVSIQMQSGIVYMSNFGFFMSFSLLNFYLITLTGRLTDVNEALSPKMTSSESPRQLSSRRDA